MWTKSLLQSDRVPEFRSTQVLVPEWLEKDSIVLRNRAVSQTAVPAMAEPRKWLVERLFAQHRGALQAFFYRRIRTKFDAPDLAQEVYVRMLRVSDIHAIRDPERYLYTVASNLVKEYAVLDRWQARGVDLDEASIQQRLGELPTPDGQLGVTQRVARLRLLAGSPPRPDVTEFPPGALRVNAGYQVRVDTDGVSAQPVPVNVQQTVAWLQRQIAFEQRPLGEVADEFNRYASSPIEIDDAALRALPISGVFDAYDIDSFVAFLQTLDGVRVERTNARIRVFSVKSLKE
jgi:Sigma-70 region 2